MEYRDYLDGTAELLRESEQETDRYEVDVLGRTFDVLPGVFSPRYFKDTAFFAREVGQFVGEDDSFLEIGPGSGIISVFAALQGASVDAVDINPAAVQNTRMNVLRHGVEDRINVYEGDLYDQLPDMQYDIIFWNTPFGLVPEETELTDLERAVFDPGYDCTRRFFEQAPDHMRTDGRLLVGFSDTLGRPDILAQYAERAGLDMRKIRSEESDEVHPVTWDLYMARPNGSP